MGIMASVIRPMEQKRLAEHPLSDATRESPSAENQFAFQRQMNGGWSMSNIVTGRQLRAARILAGLTQRQLAQAVGVHERAARYWELKEDKPPTSTPSSLEKIEVVLRDHGVIVFATPTAGVRLATDVAAQRVIRDQSWQSNCMRNSFAVNRQCRICQAISIVRRRKMER
jgi:DNA-binding XRE family transcriptional regulator